MGEVRQLFEADPEEATRCYFRPRRDAVAEQREVEAFVMRVRIHGSGAVMRPVDRLEAWRQRRVQANAQAAFEAPLRWGWC